MSYQTRVFSTKITSRPHFLQHDNDCPSEQYIFFYSSKIQKTMTGGRPYRDVFQERARVASSTITVEMNSVVPLQTSSSHSHRSHTIGWSIASVVSGCACIGITIAFLFALLYVPLGIPPSGTVAIDNPVGTYGFGPNKTLLIFNLTAFSGNVFGQDEERGLDGIDDIHADEERLASITMHRNGLVYNGIKNIPIAVDQKGGLRGQLNLGFEFRDQDDVLEDDKFAMIDGVDDKYEDYFIRGCFLERSCTRDLTPTVLDMTPRMLGETVEVLFWHDDRGFTYEGVYNLFVKLKRSVYEDTVPWDSKGKKSDDVCSDVLTDIGIVYESEWYRPDRGSYSDFEMDVEAAAKYPKSSYWEEVRGTCDPNVYNDAAEYYLAPNMKNMTEVALNLHTFAQMYMASQLLLQVDFGFRGMQQYYYKSPGETTLSTGPLYDLDGPWDICTDKTHSPDIHTCSGNRPSPIWEALGNNDEFIRLLSSPTGLQILRRDYDAVDQLFRRRMGEFNAGYFDRHEERWPMTGRTVDLSSHLLELIRGMRDDSRDTIGHELTFQMEVYRQRFQLMNDTLPDITRYSIHVSQMKYITIFLTYFWWFFTLVPLTLIGSCICVVLQRRIPSG